MKLNIGKIKFNKNKYASLALLILFIASTFAPTLLQGLGWNRRTENPQTIELPEENIIDYELTAEQRNYMIKQGTTILEYRYPLVCESCTAQKAYLEYAINEFPTQLFLEEILDNSRTESTLSIASYYGNTRLENLSNDDIFNALCEFMVDPPIRCATISV